MWGADLLGDRRFFDIVPIRRNDVLAREPWVPPGFTSSLSKELTNT